MNYVTMHIGQAKVAATGTVREFHMLDVEQMKDSGPKVVDGRFVFDDVIAVFVSLAVN